jgi:hypothetical protein
MGKNIATIQIILPEGASISDIIDDLARSFRVEVVHGLEPSTPVTIELQKHDQEKI